MTRESEHSHLVIEGRVRTITNDGIWRPVKVYYDKFTVEGARVDLAAYRMGFKESPLFIQYRPDAMEYRLVRETSYQRQSSEVLA